MPAQRIGMQLTRSWQRAAVVLYFDWYEYRTAISSDKFIGQTSLLRVTCFCMQENKNTLRILPFDHHKTQYRQQQGTNSIATATLWQLACSPTIATPRRSSHSLNLEHALSTAPSCVEQARPPASYTISQCSLLVSFRTTRCIHEDISSFAYPCTVHLAWKHIHGYLNSWNHAFHDNNHESSYSSRHIHSQISFIICWTTSKLTPKLHKPPSTPR